MPHTAKILADSMPYGSNERLVTFEVTFPRIVLAEFNTHCMLARNSASSRAIPVEKMAKRLLEDPYIPINWGKNQKGMQAEEELTSEQIEIAEKLWRSSATSAVERARSFLDLGLHKQITNRLLEPFMWHTVITTATDWSNFFNLRANKMAHPEIQRVAELMLDLYKSSTPTSLSDVEWHTPLVTDFNELADEWHNEKLEPGGNDLWEAVVKVSAGRCARVSYLTHDGKREPHADADLFDKLKLNGHMSPFEHVARPMTKHEREIFERKEYVWEGTPTCGKWVFTGRLSHYCGKFDGWVQVRKLIPGEQDILGHRKEGVI